MIKRLVANFSLYSFAEMFTKGLGFILLPLYTRLLVPADYGILAIVGAIASVLLPLITLGTRGAIHRFFFNLMTTTNVESLENMLEKLPSEIRQRHYSYNHS